MVIIIYNYNYDNFPKEILKKLCLENKKEMYILLFIFSELVSLYKIHNHKNELIASVVCPEKLKCFPDTFLANITTNVISLFGTIFYLCIAKNEYKNNDDPTNLSYSYSLITEYLAIFVTLINFYNTLYERQRDCIEGTDGEDNAIDLDDGEILPDITNT